MFKSYQNCRSSIEYHDENSNNRSFELNCNELMNSNDHTFDNSTNSDQPQSKYRVLCVKVPKKRLRNCNIVTKLGRVYRQFDHSIRLLTEKDYKLAYIYFRTPSIAEYAKTIMPIINLFGHLTLVQPVYKKHSPSDDYQSRAIYSLNQNVFPDLDQCKSNFIDDNETLLNGTNNVSHYSRTVSPKLVIERRLRMGQCQRSVYINHNLGPRYPLHGSPSRSIQRSPNNCTPQIELQHDPHSMNNNKLSNPTRTICVGGFGPQTSISQLIQILEKFGPVVNIHKKEDTCIYVQFITINIAMAAVEGMIGTSFEYFGHELTVDYADDYIYYISWETKSNNNTSNDFQEESKRQNKERSYQSDGESKNTVTNDETESEYEEKNCKLGKNNNILSSGQLNNSHFDFFRSSEKPPHHISIGINIESDLWQGMILCKNSQFPAKFHLISGDPWVIKTAITNRNNKLTLNLTLRLCFKKLLEHIHDMYVWAIFLATPCSENSVANNDKCMQTLPLNHLVRYFKNKKAAGVKPLALARNSQEKSDVSLVAFPICKNISDILKINVENLAVRSNDSFLITIIQDNLLY